MTITIKEVPFDSEEYKEVLQLRYEILRKPLGLEVSAKDVATDDKEFHIAAFEDEKIIGCVVLRPLTADIIKLRQMAVSGSQQGKGIGTKIVKYAEELAASRGFKIMETHARTVAQGFYERLGYVTQGGAFIEATVPNIKMLKSLDH